MSGSPLFKRAFVRGLNSELIRQGVVVYPSKEAADFSADYVADNSNMPDPYTQAANLNIKVAAALCENLVKAAQHLCKENGNRYQPSVTKTAQASSPVTLATTGAWEVMEKCAAETGSLYEGGDATNDMPAAAMDNGEAAQEQNRRPENYANLGEAGVGNYERKGEGSVGTEEKHPEAPQATDAGTNSVIENTNKQGSLASIVRRISKRAADEGSLFTPGGDANDLPAAAVSNAEAAQELNRRGENYANKGEQGVGQSDMVPTSAQQVGTEQPHPEAPPPAEGGSSNSVIDMSKSAFARVFEDTAKAMVPYLPTNMPDTEKVAAVRLLMGQDNKTRANYLESLYTQLGAQKTAAANIAAQFLKKAAEGEMPPFMMNKDKEEDKKPMPSMKSDEEEDDDKEECPPEEKKEASTRSLSALQQALARLNG